MKVKLIVICCIVVLVILIIVFSIVNTNLAYVKLEKMGEIRTENDYGEEYWKWITETPDLVIGGWSMMTEKNKELFNITKDIELKLNLREYNYVFSYGREIKEIKYKRDMNYPITYSKYTTTVFKKENYPHKIFVYKIDKSKEVLWDLKGNISVDIKIEDD